MDDVWYSGLRAVATRALTEEDLASIRRFRRGRKHDEVVAMLVPLAIVAIGIALARALHYRDAGMVVGPGAVAAMMMTRPWRVSDAARRQFVALRKDEIRGDVVICEGRVAEVFFAHDEERRLQPRALLHRRPDEGIVIEVLAESGAILTINGERALHLSETRRSTTAPMSAHAHAAANFARPHSTGVAYGERALSDAERAELARHAPAVSRTDILVAGATVLLAIAAWWCAVALREPTLLVPVIATIAAVWLVPSTVIRWRIYRRFAADLANGRVFIVRAAEDGVPVGPANEFLSISGIIWTDSDEPARWRRAPAARQVYVRRRT